MTNYAEPDFNTAKNVLDNSLKKNEIITIYCDCEVNYEGRAYSKLERGGRVVTIKKDKTIIFHRSSGFSSGNSGWILPRPWDYTARLRMILSASLSRFRSYCRPMIFRISTFFCTILSSISTPSKR